MPSKAYRLLNDCVRKVLQSKNSSKYVSIRLLSDSTHRFPATLNEKLDSLKFQSVMRCVPSPIVVVTAIIQNENEVIRRGITCSSFTSVSLDPSLISFCINQPSRIQTILEKTNLFAVHVLADDQVSYGLHFSRPAIDGINQFESIPHTNGLHNLPIIDDVAAVMQCEGYEMHNIGDHTVWYGNVVECFKNEEKNPLLYYKKSFRNLGDQAFMDQFERAELKFKDWTHEAHLRVAWNYMKKCTFNEALPLIKNGIKKFNQQHADKIKRGYHETITMFYAHFVNLAINTMGDHSTFEQFIAKNKFLLNRDLLFMYYSREVISKEKARLEFVPPDKSPLPES